MAGIKQGTKQGFELTTKEVSGWAGKAIAGDILRAGKGLYLARRPPAASGASASRPQSPVSRYG